MLLTKAREYQKELVTVIASDPVYCTTYSIDAMPETPSLTISELAGYREGLHQKEHELKLRRAKLKAYQGLPPVRAYLAPLDASLSLCMRLYTRTLSLLATSFAKHEQNKQN